jgi:divalent metal cation (Fe/Co/Zn/Cd) transporter
LVAWAFAALALALAVAAVRDFVTGRRPDESVWGAVYLISAAAVMLGLGLAKHRVAAGLDSAPLRSEATLTMLDSALAAGTAAGLALNILVGWWWADPLAALVVSWICVGEARENLAEAAEWEARAAT